MNRRDLFLTSAAFLCLGPLAARSRAETAPPSTLKPEFFTRDPYMSPPQLSPDGSHLAWIEDNRVIVHDLKDNSEKVLNGGENRLDVLQWVGNDHMVVYLKDDEIPKSTYYVKVVNYSPMVVSRDAKFLRLLFERDGKKIAYEDLQPIIRFIDGPAPYLITLERGYTGMIDLATGKRKSGEFLLPGDDHFFDRGGTSLSAVKLAIALDRAVTIDDVTRHPVLADLAGLLDQRHGKEQVQ